MSDTSHAEDHTGPIKTPKQLLITVFFSFVAPVVVIIGLVYFVVSQNKPAAGSSNPEKSIAQRIEKVGSVEIRDANRELKSGEEVYKVQCAACHTSGAAGAPKIGDTAAWSTRIAIGYEALVNSALKGKNAMAAQGGGNFEDVEIARSVVYLANAGGAKFEAPKAPGAAASAPAAASK